jgi:AcrR family transcriptional regulator
VARPRIHDLDALLDAAEILLAEGGSGALTIRALAERTGAPSGSLYHAFGSRNELLGRMWLRAANRFLDLQRAAVAERLGDGAGYDDAIAATIAAAAIPAVLAATAPATAKLLLEQRRETIIEKGLPEPLSTQLQALDAQLLALMRTLADALFGRRDRRAVETVAVCIVDLPTALLNPRRQRIIDPLATLEAAIRGILASAAPARA